MKFDELEKLLSDLQMFIQISDIENEKKVQARSLLKKANIHNNTSKKHMSLCENYINQLNNIFYEN